jgi:hypothetical protein
LLRPIEFDRFPELDENAMNTPEDKPGRDKMVRDTDQPPEAPRRRPWKDVFKVLLIIILGIPAGLFAISVLVLGVCLLGGR